MNLRLASKRMNMLASAVALALIFLRISTPYLHSHGLAHSETAEIISASCAACELESTPISDSADPVVIPERPFEQIITSTPAELSLELFSISSPPSLRGPPAAQS
ncbi:MAG TPA: hypothetical protein VEW28_02870 [Candidatus Kapabacteria bacterium]|nr:hypothetical protein [Candidatus Kapabacteria bacterium]